jgi:cytochrome c oxidase cbb3-type subunit I/II
MSTAAVVSALMVGALGLGVGQLPAQTSGGGDPARGRQVYERYCVQCHGDRADGAGEVARWSQPKPRDFRQGVFKFTSTAYGLLPTTADLDRVIQNGLYGTRMPPFAALSGRERRDVIAYLQTRSPRWRTEQPGTPLPIPAEPTPTRESVTKGRELFEANCAKCHGDGTGNGTAAAKGMLDDWGMAIAPANLTLGRGKWARTARDIYVRAMAGINGTPMPESGDALTREQVWQVAHYVQALGGWPGSTPELRQFAAQLPPPSGAELPAAGAPADTTKQ